ncbi:MAG: hypothetical protein KAH05_02795 [Clostridiales bacterium]|nr:hypothetical protein [Clostridiales bacterium]
MFKKGKPKHRKILTTILIIVIGVGGISFFEQQYYKLYMGYPVDLSSEIQSALNDTESSIINMKDLTGDCEWDTMYILTPYNDVDKFLSDNNIKWHGDIAYGIELFDSIELLVFKLGDEVSCFAEINLSVKSMNFSKIVYKNDGKIEYSVEEAIFNHMSK